MPEDQDHIFKVGDLVRFAKASHSDLDAPIQWSGKTPKGGLVEIPELTPAIVTQTYADSQGNPMLDVFVMNNHTTGWYDTSFEEWWDLEEKNRGR